MPSSAYTGWYKPKPTRYRSTLFRSRLEARWAAFFDLCGWPWEYEPLELRGYLPDFILPFEHAPILVEVKPCMYLEDLDEHADKIEASGWDKEILLLGARIFPEQGRFGLVGNQLGQLAERWPDDSGVFNWGEAYLFHCMECDKFSFCHSWMLYACRVTGCHDGDHHLGLLPDGYVEELWALAGEKTRWLPGRKPSRIDQ